MPSAASSQARTPMSASGAGRVSALANRTPAAVRLATRIGARGGNVQRFGRHRADGMVEPLRVVPLGQSIAARGRPRRRVRRAGPPRSAISSRTIASSRTIGPMIVRPSARSASSSRSRSSNGSQRVGSWLAGRDCLHHHGSWSVRANRSSSCVRVAVRRRANGFQHAPEDRRSQGRVGVEGVPEGRSVEGDDGGGFEWRRPWTSLDAAGPEPTSRCNRRVRRSGRSRRFGREPRAGSPGGRRRRRRTNPRPRLRAAATAPAGTEVSSASAASRVLVASGRPAPNHPDASAASIPVSMDMTSNLRGRSQR